jgi:hypothetical protein
MRQPVTLSRLHEFMKALGSIARVAGRVYLVGGATAVVLAWRTATIDIDLKIVPETDQILRAIPELKERLQLNIELASPEQFIPELPGWQDRSQFVQTEGKLSFYHYDFYAQALAKIERGHAIDLVDVEQMIQRGIVERNRLLELFKAIEDKLYLYPALDPSSFRRAVEHVISEVSPAS